MADDGRPIPAPRTINAAGQQVIKGGSTVDAGFFQSIQDAYANVTQNAPALIYTIFVVMVSAAEIHEGEGMLENIAYALQEAKNDPNELRWVTTLAGLLLHVVKILVNHKLKFCMISWVWIPFLFKPSTKNMWVSAVLSLFVLISKSLDFIEIIAISNLFFLWASMRNPTHKLIIVLVGVGVFVYAMGIEVKPKKVIGGSTPSPVPTTKGRV